MCKKQLHLLALAHTGRFYFNFFSHFQILLWFRICILLCQQNCHTQKTGIIERWNILKPYLHMCCLPCTYTLQSGMDLAKPLLKIRAAIATFGSMYLGIFRDNTLKNILFTNKTFLFFKIESWNFQDLFEIEFRETSQNFNSFSSFRQLLFSIFLLVVWLSWNVVSFLKSLFQTDAESFSFLSWKTKKVLFLKKYFLSRTAKIDPKDGTCCPNF